MTQVTVTSPPVTSMRLMSCVRESSPPIEPVPPPEIVRHESKRKRFNPLLSGLRRIFGKKSRTSSNTSAPDSSGTAHIPADSAGSVPDPMRSRSTSQLSDNAPAGDPGALKSRSINSTLLSLSHDSVFTAESGTSEVDTSSCLSVQKTAQSSVRAELLDVMRRRKLQREDTSDEEDLGLPRSPLSSPHHKTTHHNHSTCSEGSLLSMGSSELEDDATGPATQSRQSSRVYEKKLTITHDADAELNISVTLPSVPKLSHSAAKHKMAVRPKRTHGAPRKRKHQIASVTTPLPATPEVNEDTSSARTALSDSEDNSIPQAEVTKVMSTEQLNKVAPPCLKSSSLPAGALPPSSLRLSRSRSNATPPPLPSTVKSSLSDDMLRKQDASFFSRLLMRRSGKKKKGEEEDALPPVIPHKRMDEKGQYLVDINNITSKQYPSSRQRVEPLNIPLEENAINRMHVSYVTSLPSEEDMDSIQVVQPEPYLLRMYSGEFHPVPAFSYQDCTEPDNAVTMPDIHSAPETGNESQDVLVDETVIENIAPAAVDDINKPHEIVISHKTTEKPELPQKPVACVIPVRPRDLTSQVSKVFLNNQPESLEISEEKAESPVQPRDRIQHLSLNLVENEASPRRSIPSSPLRDCSSLTQRSPLREISPFKLSESPSHEIPSPFLSKRFSPSPRTPRKDTSDFFSDHSPIIESQVEDTTTATKVKEIPSPVTPKDLILPIQNSPTKVKESAFTKEIPSPIMPKDVFQFNTGSNNNNVDKATDKIEKSASFTELKKDIPIPAPRISLRKDNSLPAMPEYMKVHVTTQETKKSMSSSCESLDMQDQVQSSSYSDSCDSMDNIDQWRNKKKEIPWRNRYSEISSSDSDDKQLSITPDGSDVEKKMEEEEISIVQLRRKSFTKDWTLTHENTPPRPLRQKSLEPELLKKDSCNNLNEVVLRRKSLSKEIMKNSNESDEPELLKVFARRSLKIPKDFDVNDNSIDFTNVKIVSKDSDKENEAVIPDTCENMNQHFPLDNDKVKLKKNYESIIITTNKNLDNDDTHKAQQKELIKPFSSNIKVNINENKTINSNNNTVVKTLNINTDVSKKVEDKAQNNETDSTDVNVNKIPSTETVDNMKGFKKIQQRREEWEQRMQQARKTQP